MPDYVVVFIVVAAIAGAVVLLSRRKSDVSAALSQAIDKLHQSVPVKPSIPPVNVPASGTPVPVSGTGKMPTTDNPPESTFMEDMDALTYIAYTKKWGHFPPNRSDGVPVPVPAPLPPEPVKPPSPFGYRDDGQPFASQAEADAYRAAVAARDANLAASAIHQAAVVYKGPFPVSMLTDEDKLFLMQVTQTVPGCLSLPYDALSGTGLEVAQVIASVPLSKSAEYDPTLYGGPLRSWVDAYMAAHK